MIAIQSMLLPMAKEAGISVPLDCEEYEPNSYVKWHVFSVLQLGRSMPHMGCHWENAKLIASFTDEQLKEMSYDDFLNAGFQ